MIENVDKGKILFQKKLPIYPSDTGFTLYHRMVAEFLIEFDSFFEKFVTTGLEPRDMPEGGSFYRREIPFAGYIDHSWLDDKIALFIRAMFFPPFEGALAKFNEVEIEIDSIEQYMTLRDKYTK
jgi:methionyl-tRNA formyltransferase